MFATLLRCNIKTDQVPKIKKKSDGFKSGVNYNAWEMLQY